MHFDLIVSQLREEAQGAHKHDHEMLFEVAADAIEDLQREITRKEALEATATIRRAYRLVRHKESSYDSF